MSVWGGRGVSLGTLSTLGTLVVTLGTLPDNGDPVRVPRGDPGDFNTRAVFH